MELFNLKGNVKRLKKKGNFEQGKFAKSIYRRSKTWK